MVGDIAGRLEVIGARIKQRRRSSQRFDNKESMAVQEEGKQEEGSSGSHDLDHCLVEASEMSYELWRYGDEIAGC